MSNIRFSRFLQATTSRRTQSNEKTIARSKRVAVVKTKSLSRRHKTGQTAPTPTPDPPEPTPQTPKSQTHFPSPSRNQKSNNAPVRFQPQQLPHALASPDQVRPATSHSGTSPRTELHLHSTHAPLGTRLPEALEEIPHVVVFSILGKAARRSPGVSLRTH